MFELFIKECYEEAIKLKKQFAITEEKKWSALTITNELFVQLGHYSFIICNNTFVKENGRIINNPKDELSDILLQLCALCGKLNIDKNNIKPYYFIGNSLYESVLQLLTLVGQLTECIMELEGYRHSKERIGYSTKIEFITERINKCLSIIFKIAESQNYDMIYEFNLMKKSSLNFLENYRKEKHYV